MTEPAPRLLFRPGDAVPAPTGDIPSWAVDLRLDELAPALGGGELGRRRLAIVLRPLPDADAVTFRQEVFADLETPAVAAGLGAFAAAVQAVRAATERAGRIRHPAERDRWVLDALDRHDEAVLALLGAVRAAGVQSRALRAVAAHLEAHVASAAFTARRDAVRETLAALDAVAFRLRIGESRVVVSPVRDDPDLAAEIRAAFARFRDAEPAPVRVDVFDTLDMNPLEADVLARVARLAPEPFARLAATSAAHREVVDPALAAIADDAGWYLAVADVLAPLRAAGLGVGRPEIAADGRLDARGLVDLVLARRLLEAGHAVQASDLHLAPDERVVIVTGPSQSGRTSFARALGQLHVLASSGCPVAARSATVPLADGVQTVFDQPERLDDPGGRLRTELRRVRAMLDAAGPRTLVVANEPFASTTAADALGLARRLLGSLAARGARVVAVTFLDELADDPGSVSVAAAAPLEDGDPAARTFRFERRPAEGLAHAQRQAERHGLTSTRVAARVRR